MDQRQVAERIETLLAEMAGADPGPAEKAEELVGLLVRMYGDGLSRIIGALDEQVVRRLANDRVISGLLVLHELHPDSLDARITQALDTVRPYLGSHGGAVEYLGVDDAGVARLRLQGSCDGCPSSTVTVKASIEAALFGAAPEITGVEVAGMENGHSNGLLQIRSSRAPA